MKYLDGATLKSLIAGRALELDRLLTIAFGIVEGLEAAHGKDIVHGDMPGSPGYNNPVCAFGITTDWRPWINIDCRLLSPTSATRNANQNSA
jgi:hypothetical protein